MTTDFHPYSGGATQAQIEQHQVGLVLLNQTPESRFVLCRSDNLRLRDLITKNTFCAFQFQRHVFYDNYFEVIHDCNSY